MNKLLELIHSPYSDDFSTRSKEAIEELFGSPGGRYPDRARQAISIRAPEIRPGSGVPFTALIDPSNPDSGAYGGMSFVIFPGEESPAGIAMVVGTQGLSPDEEILGRPGHGRKVKAICSWLNSEYGLGQMTAWSKQDPARIDLDLPGNVKDLFPQYMDVFKRYGKVIYGLYVPGDDQAGTEMALKAFLDLMFAERGFRPLKGAEAEAKKIEAAYYAHLFPFSNQEKTADLLDRRKYVILQGPPGTGKTRLALELLEKKYQGRGQTIQFHPNTTYENFVGGLAPVQTEEELGFKFAPQPGFLMEAAKKSTGEFRAALLADD